MFLLLLGMGKDFKLDGGGLTKKRMRCQDVVKFTVGVQCDHIPILILVLDIQSDVLWDCEHRADLKVCIRRVVQKAKGEGVQHIIRRTRPLFLFKT